MGNISWARVTFLRPEPRVQVIAQHLQHFVPGPALGEHFRYDVLSNDNGFLPYPVCVQGCTVIRHCHLIPYGDSVNENGERQWQTALV
jgi:hypothetical protein